MWMEVQKVSWYLLLSIMRDVIGGVLKPLLKGEKGEAGTNPTGG